MQKQFSRISEPYGHCLNDGEDEVQFIYHGFNYSVEVSASLALTISPLSRVVIAVARNVK